MDYTKIYNELMLSRKNIKRDKKTGIFENHHIIPKCLNGNNTKENMVLLTPKEHYIAHLLLTQMYDGKNKAKMCYALLMMCGNNKFQNRVVSSRQYEYAKNIVSENCKGENASFYGKKLSDIVKQNLSLRMMGENNPSKKYPIWNKGKKTKALTQTHKDKISKKLKSNNRKLSETHKQTISKALKDKPKSDEHKKKLSELNKGKIISVKTRELMSKVRKGKKQKELICPHCQKVGGTTMHRWHFDNCKNKV